MDSHYGVAVLVGVCVVLELYEFATACLGFVEVFGFESDGCGDVFDCAPGVAVHEYLVWFGAW